jgi:hypothetical protein
LGKTIPEAEKRKQERENAERERQNQEKQYKKRLDALNDLVNSALYKFAQATDTAVENNTGKRRFSGCRAAKTSPLPPTAVGANAWIQFAFDQPQTFKALTFAGGEPAGAFFATATNRNLEESDDGVNFRQAAQIGIQKPAR